MKSIIADSNDLTHMPFSNVIRNDNMNLYQKRVIFHIVKKLFSLAIFFFIVFKFEFIKRQGAKMSLLFRQK